jgi:hypothetical protein
MDIRQSLFSFIAIGIALIAGYFLFRREPREAALSRGPLFIVCFLLLLSIGIGNLPLAMPSLFEHLIGHSVWVDYMPPVKLNVTRVGGTWWLVRWKDPIETGYFYLFLAGIAWAILNIVQRRARKLNVFCVCAGALLMLASLIFSFACYPFCF